VYGLVFWFIYRVVVGAFRHLTQENREKQPEPSAKKDAESEQQSDYRDVKDATFKDLPNDSKKPS